MKIVRSLLSLLVALSCCAVQAAQFTTTTTQAGGQAWTNTIWQPGGVSPVAGNTYECLNNGTPYGANATGGSVNNTRIRNIATAGLQTFPGDQLTLNTNSEIRAEQAGAILNFPGVGGNPGLILNGGMLNAGDDAQFVITGKVRVAATSFIVPADNGAGAITPLRGFNFRGHFLKPVFFSLTSVLPGLAGYWPFDEKTGQVASDNSGNGNYGTLNNFPTDDSEWVAGLTGGALSFGGPVSQDYVRVADYPTVSTTFSLSAWVLAAGPQARWASIMKNWGGAVPGQFHFGLRGDNPNNFGKLSCYITTPSGLVLVQEEALFPTNSTWEHVAVVADGAMLRLYHNGVQVGATPYAGQISPATVSALGIGAKLNDLGTGPDPANPGFWTGLLDDVALWTRGLSFSEVQNLYVAGTNGVSLGSVIQPLAITSLTPYVDPLPIPPVAKPARLGTNCLLPGALIPEYDMPMVSFQHQFHRDLPPVEVWGYHTNYPGPTVMATTNVPIQVNWMNRLPTNFPFWLFASMQNSGVPDQSVRTVVHLHGAASRPQFDGFPTNWFRTGETAQYLYDNLEFGDDGETLWYHDHAMGVTANTVYAGLEGLYILRSPGFEAPLNLPSGEFEVPLMIQDRDIQTNCPPASLLFNNIVPWHYLPVVNGKVMPYFEVEPRKYRFRILNGSNFRTFGMELFDGTNNIPFYEIGTDDGFLQATFKAADIKLMPAERVDVIVDFTNLFGHANIVMKNSLRDADVPFAPFITNVMQFRVTRMLSSPDTSSIPTVLVPNWIYPTNLAKLAVTNREITIDLCSQDPSQNCTNCEYLGGPFATNHHVNALLNLTYFDEPVTETPHAGDVEIWSLINLTDEAHPIHVHLLDFFILDRTHFTNFNGGDLSMVPSGVSSYIADRRANQLRPLATYLDPNNHYQTVKPYEAGPKDVVHAAPYAVTRIVMQWPCNSRFWDTNEFMQPPCFDKPEETGRYIFHCHLLDHEDNEMMRPMQLLPPRAPFVTISKAADLSRVFIRFNTSACSYSVERSLDLINWLPWRVVVGDGTTATVSDDEFLPHRFYRVRLLAPE